MKEYRTQLRGFFLWPNGTHIAAFARGLFSSKLALRGMQMAFHGASGFYGISIADGAINIAVRLKGWPSVLGALGGLAPLIVKRGRHRFHEGGEDGIARSLSDGPVKAHIMDQILGRIVGGCVHLSHFFGELGQMLFCSALGGERRQVCLQQFAGLKHLPGFESVKRAEQTERSFSKLGGPVRDESTHAMAYFHDAEGCQITDTCPEAGTADIQRLGKLALGRNFVSGLQCAVFNFCPNVIDHLLGSLTIKNFRFHEGSIRYMRFAELFRTLRLAPTSPSLLHICVSGN